MKVKGLAPLAAKTDKIDARVLAELGRRDLVPAVALRYVRRRVGVAAMRARWPGTDDGFALLGRVVRFRPSD